MDEIQTITFSTLSVAGTFTLTFNGDTTTAIAWNASASTIQAALEALGSIGSGNVSVTGDAYTTGTITIEFVGSMANASQSQTTCDSSLLECDGTIAAVSVTTPGYYEYDLGWTAASQGGNGVVSSLIINGEIANPGFFDASIVQSYLSLLDPTVQVTGGCTDLGIQDGSGNEMFSGSFVILYQAAGAITSAAFTSNMVDASGLSVGFSTNGAGAGVAEVESIPQPTATDGTFSIDDGSSTNTPVAYDISMADMQTALNALPNITAAGGVTVSGSDGGPWNVTFNTPGSVSPSPMIVVADIDLEEGDVTNTPSEEQTGSSTITNAVTAASNATGAGDLTCQATVYSCDGTIASNGIFAGAANELSSSGTDNSPVLLILQTVLLFN